MRVIHLLNHCRFGHGNVHATVDLACAQVARGDDVWIASGKGELLPLLAQQGITHALIPQESRKPLDVLRIVLALWSLVRHTRPDVLHAHMMTGAVVGWVVSRLTGVKLVTTVHNAFEGHATLMKLGDRVVCVSGAVNEIMARRGFPRQKLRTVLNGTLHAPRRDFFGREPITLPRPNVATVCGLHDRKGVSDLIKAFDAVARARPGVDLFIVGEGPDQPKYEALAASLDCAPRIHFLGQLHDTKSLLQTVDVFALASLSDPCPLVIPEAREAGCAIVATNVDGIPEALDGGAAGVLVNPSAPDELGAALVGALEPTEMHRLQQAARQNLEFWSTARVAEDIARVYAEIVRR